MAGRIVSDERDIISEINIIPLVDISLVLLIIFMVTANYVMTTFIKVDVPKAEYAKTGEFSKVFNITIARDGTFYLLDKPVKLNELKSRLSGLSHNNPDPEIILNADKNVNFKSVVSVIDLLSDLNINKINIATVQE
jgi:biopolymer transport protein ExbD